MINQRHLKIDKYQDLHIIISDYVNGGSSLPGINYGFGQSTTPSLCEYYKAQSTIGPNTFQN